MRDDSPRFFLFACFFLKKKKKKISFSSVDMNVGISNTVPNDTDQRPHTLGEPAGGWMGLLEVLERGS